MAEQTVNKRANGQFAKGNKIGNRFKPGESGNPNGRNGAMADLFKDLAEVTDEQGKTRKEKILDKILKMAENGSLKAAEMYMNRVEGKPREYVEQRIKKDEIIIE
jgi:hypothetical protein|tara:strand:- start:21 stop:335 length:315 start_codon:yes stop_codon:yes gene_type:complete